MASPVEEIKERLSVVTVVSSYIKLDKAGQNYKARCPFHNEKTPSFVVSPSRNAYHCFGCNRGGDIFSFVEEIEGVDFKEALKLLAERAGVKLERFDPKKTAEDDALRTALLRATQFFEENLKKNPEALAYLKKRGLSDETVSEWRLGYAPDEWRALLAHLAKAKVGEEAASRAGLVVKNEKQGVAASSRYYDRFRGRIMFPLSDGQGRIVGFSGRAFGGDAETGAKYLNSPETPLFQKSRVLYGYDKAKSAMLKEGRAVLVEGQMDLIMSHQAGVRSAIASSGTAFTVEHVGLIKRFATNLVLAFDGDDAGFAAAERAYLIAAPLGLDVRLAKLPRGMDPADLAGKDPASWRTAVDESRHIIDFYLASLKERAYDERTLKQEVSRRVIPYIKAIPNSIDQAHFVKEVSRFLAVPEEAVWEDVKKAPALAMSETAAEAPAGRPPLSRAALIDRKVTGMVLWQESLPPEKRLLDIGAAKEGYARAAGTPFPEELADRAERLLEAELQYEDKDELAQELDELLEHREETRLSGELAENMAKLRAAEGRGDEKEVEALFSECDRISKRINELKRPKAQ